MRRHAFGDFVKKVIVVTLLSVVTHDAMAAGSSFLRRLLSNTGLVGVPYSGPTEKRCTSGGLNPQVLRNVLPSCGVTQRGSALFAPTDWVKFPHSITHAPAYEEACMTGCGAADTLEKQALFHLDQQPPVRGGHGQCSAWYADGARAVADVASCCGRDLQSQVREQFVSVAIQTEEPAAPCGLTEGGKTADLIAQAARAKDNFAKKDIRTVVGECLINAENRVAKEAKDAEIVSLKTSHETALNAKATETTDLKTSHATALTAQNKVISSITTELWIERVVVAAVAVAIVCYVYRKPLCSWFRRTTSAWFGAQKLQQAVHGQQHQGKIIDDSKLNVAASRRTGAPRGDSLIKKVKKNPKTTPLVVRLRPLMAKTPKV